MMKDIRIALATCSSSLGNIDKNLHKMEHIAEDAKKKGAAIVCFPELNITGYGGSDQLRSVADSIPGRISEKLIASAVALNIVLLAGMVQLTSDKRLFASHLVITPDRLAGVYQKLHIPFPEKKIFTPGDTIPIFDLWGLKFGIQLCYDAHFPDLTTYMALKGADAVFLPHASPNGNSQEKFTSWMRHLPARAYDNSLFILACNQSGFNEDRLSFPGIALAVGPSGKIIKKCLSEEDAVMIVDLKTEDIRQVRRHKIGFFLPHRRPELYS